VRASEPKRGERFDESMLKSMTGGEPMLVRHLQKGFFEFRPVFKLALSGNHRPEIGGVDHGIWRRLRIVPWPVQIADADRRPIETVLAEFGAEASGILNWLIAGTLDYLNCGLVAPPEVTEATDDYREEMDPIGGFIRDCVTRVPAGEDGKPIEFVTARAMYEAFDTHCSVNKVRPWKEKSFAQAMTQKGFVKDRTMTVRRYINVRLHDVPVRDHYDRVPPPGDDDMPPV
jgi:putative DNA primase/helicase